MRTVTTVSDGPLFGMPIIVCYNQSVLTKHFAGQNIMSSLGCIVYHEHMKLGIPIMAVHLCTHMTIFVIVLLILMHLRFGSVLSKQKNK